LDSAGLDGGSAGTRASLEVVTVGGVALATPFGAIGFKAGAASGAWQPPNMDSGGKDDARIRARRDVQGFVQAARSESSAGNGAASRKTVPVGVPVFQ
jgi:hypothetical protein